MLNHWPRLKTLLSFVAIVAGFLPGCGGNGPCDNRICLRVTNQHQELGVPMDVQLDNRTAYLHVPVTQLGFGRSTDWFESFDGASTACESLQVVFEARADATKQWSSSQVYEFSDQPSCFVQNQKYDLVLR